MVIPCTLYSLTNYWQSRRAEIWEQISLEFRPTPASYSHIEICTCEIQYSDGRQLYKIQGWAKVGLHLWVLQTQGLFLYYYLFINYCIIYLYYFSSYYCYYFVSLIMIFYFNYCNNHNLHVFFHTNKCKPTFVHPCLCDILFYRQQLQIWRQCDT
jgi:hypothetical protein